MIERSSDLSGLVRVYRPRDADGTGLVWVHGGGFAYGGLDMPEADAVSDAIASTGTTVISFDYRLAPVSAAAARRGEQSRAGMHHPAASDDVLSAWEWTRWRRDALGHD